MANKARIRNKFFSLVRRNQLSGGLMSWFVRSRVKENRMQRDRDLYRRSAESSAEM